VKCPAGSGWLPSPAVDSFTERGTGIRSDGALLSAHLAGDRHAFAELMGRHLPRMYRLARGRSRTAADADDAVQDAMLAAHRAAGGFRHDAAVASWLHRIVVNACTDLIRRNAARPTVTLSEDIRAAADDTGRVDTSVVVRQALMRLPAEQRAAVVAVDMHGYSVADAARLLGVAEGTVKSRRARARTRLAVLLRPPVSAAP